MASIFEQDQKKLQPDQLNRLFNRHRQGALVRTGASLFMWLFALASFLLKTLTAGHMIGISMAVAYLILINPPTLWILKHIDRRRTYELFSILINLLEIIGYTAIIYCLGGINALYLSPIYAALIAYVGAVGPPSLPFVIASLCSAGMTIMVGMEYFGIIPHRDPFWDIQLPVFNQLTILLANICLLFVVAFITSYTGNILRKNKNKLHKKNLELEKSRLDLKVAADTLENKNVELQLTANRARESDRMKSEFLANMSHEFRTPLNHIIGFTEVVVDKKFGDLNGNQQKYLSNVLQSGQHLLSLVNDILDLSKVESGTLKLEFSELNLRSLLENSLTMIKEKAIKHGITLSIESDGAPETISADERKLKQIMYNLLSNAVKFTPDGGSITLATKMISDPEIQHSQTTGAENSKIQNPWPGPVKQERQTVSILGSDSRADSTGEGTSLQGGPESKIAISVADTGIGIKKEDLENIFNPFEQVESSASRKYQGTGLGLSLTKKLVELHGGRIWAESKGEGKGSVFNFLIPADLS
jgi:signal transduction histidine kinase